MITTGIAPTSRRADAIRNKLGSYPYWIARTRSRGYPVATNRSANGSETVMTPSTSNRRGKDIS